MPFHDFKWWKWALFLQKQTGPPYVFPILDTSFDLLQPSIGEDGTLAINKRRIFRVINGVS